MDVEQFNSELEALGGKIAIYQVDEDDEIQSASFDDWQEIFPDITPQQLFDKFEKASTPQPIGVAFDNFKDKRTYDDDGNEIERDVTAGSKIRVKIQRKSNTAHDAHREGGEIGFILLPDKPPEFVGIVKLRHADQAKGNVREYLRAIVGLLEDISADSMMIQTDRIGAYAWAKYGFTPASQEVWEQLKSDIEEKINRDNKTLHFRGEDYDISTEMQEIDDVLGTKFEDLPKAFLKLAYLGREIGEYSETGIDQTWPLTVGKAMLINKPWQGILPFDREHESFKQFDAYTDPEKYIEQGVG